MNDFKWVTNNQALVEVCDLCMAADWLAIDTEFERTTTFLPKAGLIQVGVAGEIYLIDPLTISNWGPFEQVLDAKPIVMHAASEDLEVFHTLCGLRPLHVYDTQVAAGLLGFGTGLSFAALVEALFDIELDKSESRSDWLRRPLSDRQLHYAVNDVVWLDKIYRQLLTIDSERHKWVWQHGESTSLNADANDSILMYFNRFGRAGELSARKQHYLYDLSAWREEQARDQDRPRSRILHDASMYALAELMPLSLDYMSDVPKLEHRAIRNYGSYLIELSKEVRALPEESLRHPVAKPLTKAQGKWVKQLLKELDRVCQPISVPRELVIAKKRAERIMSGYFNDGQWDIPSDLTPWRVVLVEQAIERLKLALTAEGHNET